MARFLCVSLFIMTAVGCNRQDTECLSRIGKKVAAHASRRTADAGSKFEFAWHKKEPSLQDKVQERLRWENTLSDVTFEVIVKDKEVELKGTVKTPEQRQRATELADTTAGVSKVIDSIVVKDAEEMAR
jgi:osmotically-inducible protein OsmY